MGMVTRTWQRVFMGLAIVGLTAVGLVVAQNQQPPEAPKATKCEAVSDPLKSIPDLRADIPRLTPAQQDFDAVRKPLFAGTAFANDKDAEQERASAIEALAAEEAAAPRLPDPAPNQLPLPIQVADEVVMVVEQLRGLARNLDQIAANDEDEENYERADQLRSTAARLRREARDLRTPTRPSSAQNSAPSH